MSLVYKRIASMLLGNIIIGFGIALGVLSNLGIDPGMTFFYGISGMTGLSLGFTTGLCNILFLMPLLFFDRKRIGIATVVNMLCMGYIVDFFMNTIFQNIMLEWMEAKVVILLLGVCLQSLGVAIYSSAMMGQSPLDGIPNVIIKHFPKLSYRIVRVIQDTSLVIIGFLCGSNVGIGTLVLMFLTGPLIHFFQSKKMVIMFSSENT